MNPLSNERGAALRGAFSPSMMRRSLYVAAVVGTLLNAINQGDVIFAGDEPNWSKLFLTYVVPFFVSTYGAYCSASLHARTTRDES